MGDTIPAGCVGNAVMSLYRHIVFIVFVCDSDKPAWICINLCISLSFTFFFFIIHWKVKQVVWQLCMKILTLTYSHQSTDTVATHKHLSVKCPNQDPLDNKCRGKLLLMFPCLQLQLSTHEPTFFMYLLIKRNVLDSLSMASELKVSAVSRDKQSTVTSPPWMRYQLCLRGVMPSNLSWKPVLELSFMPIKISSRAHWAECFPKKETETQLTS